MYLERRLKQQKIKERAAAISKELGMKLSGRGPGEELQIFHISAADYMTWLKKDKLLFRDRPALFPEDTGIPVLRQYLFSLPAENNVHDYRTHLMENVPSFISKIERVVKCSERDIGFRDIAQIFDAFREEWLPQILQAIIHQYQKLNHNSMAKMRAESSRYRDEIDKVVVDSWMNLPGPMMNKILKCKGTVPPGTSRAKGRECGCDWNAELAKVFARGFKRWYNAQVPATEKIAEVLIYAFDFFLRKFFEKVDMSTSSIATTDKAKRKCLRFRDGIRVKAVGCIDAVKKKQEFLKRKALMADGRQTNFMSAVTDSLFDEIFKAVPPIKGYTTRNRPKYTEPKVRFQKRKMHALFSADDKNHFVDRVLNTFQKCVDGGISAILTEHIGQIDEYLRGYSEQLSGLVPVNYEITPAGQEICANLENLLPQLNHMVLELQQCLPEY